MVYTKVNERPATLGSKLTIVAWFVNGDCQYVKGRMTFRSLYDVPQGHLYQELQSMTAPFSEHLSERRRTLGV
jgi:hypothetical protein